MVESLPEEGGFFLRFPMETNDPPIMTLIEVADYLRIPKASVYKLAQQGRIPCQKVGKHWRFRRDAVDEWLASGTRGSTRLDTALGRGR